ncbi:MAG: hypothetical protein E3J64_01360 [Anaerolineales bacterium]|nr:MAG: hypothetical protein E3J64_01360 [Anaerolineales bacterium]
MADRLSEWACCLSPLVVGAAVAGLVTWLWRSWNRRGAESAVEMDGAILVEVADGTVFVRRHRWRYWLYLVVLATSLLGALALLVGLVRDLVAPRGAVDLNLEAPCEMLGVVGVLGAATALVVRSLRSPLIRLHPASMMIEVGRRSSLRSIPFSSVSHVTARVPADRQSGADTLIIPVVIVLKDGERLGVGTVSGPLREAQERAALAAQLVADTIGVPVQDGAAG